jgi:hypothetical protein
VKQGSTILYQSDHLSFGSVGAISDSIHTIDYVYMCKVNNTEISDNVNISESVSLEIVSYYEITESITLTENFTFTIQTVIG